MSGVKPAMSSEEWADHLTSGEPFDYFESCYAEEMSGHKAAALALHGQPFGFTREDVDLLRKAADEHEWAEKHGADWTGPYEELRNLADRIEALLPPEEL